MRCPRPIAGSFSCPGQLYRDKECVLRDTKRPSLLKTQNETVGLRPICQHTHTSSEATGAKGIRCRASQVASNRSARTFSERPSKGTSRRIEPRQQQQIACSMFKQEPRTNIPRTVPAKCLQAPSWPYYQRATSRTKKRRSWAPLDVGAWTLGDSLKKQTLQLLRAPPSRVIRNVTPLPDSAGSPPSSTAGLSARERRHSFCKNIHFLLASRQGVKDLVPFYRAF